MLFSLMLSVIFSGHTVITRHVIFPGLLVFHIFFSFPTLHRTFKRAILHEYLRSWGRVVPKCPSILGGSFSTQAFPLCMHVFVGVPLYPLVMCLILDLSIYTGFCHRDIKFPSGPRDLLISPQWFISVR